MSFEEIEKHSIETYNLNIEYLKKSHPQIYSKIKLFEEAVESGAIKEKYELNYKDDYFDALNLETNEYLYNMDSEKYGEEIVKNQFTFNPKESSFKTFYEIHFSDEVMKAVENANMLSDVQISNAPVIHYVNTNLPKDEQMKSIPKVIVFGVGLGTHIPYLHFKAKPKVYFIIEPNLELFRLSLFTIKYHNIGANVLLFLSVADNEIEFNQSFDRFMGTGFIYNHYLKHFMFSKNCTFYTKLIQKRLVTQGHLTYEYSRLLQGMDRTVFYLNEEYKFLNITPNKFDKFEGKPILLLAAGPSLQRNVEFVKKNQDKFIIVALYVTMPFLEKHGIKPDIVTNYDQGGDVVYNYIKRINDLEFFKDTIFLFASHLDNRIMQSFPKENIFVFQAMYDIKVGFDAQTAPSIGEISYALLLRLSAKEIYFLGIDMALDPETNKSHIDGHTSLSNDFVDEDDNKITLKKGLLEVKGNFRPVVNTTPNFVMSINSLNLISKAFLRENTIVYNLSDGAYFEGIKPLKIEDIDIVSFETLEKNVINKNIIKSLDKLTEIGFNEFDYEVNELKLEDAGILKEKIEEFFKIKDSSLLVYEDRLGKLINDICFSTFRCSDLQKVLFNFILHNIHYIYYLINIKSLENPKKHLKNINRILSKQFLKLIDTYIKIYEKK